MFHRCIPTLRLKTQTTLPEKMLHWKTVSFFAPAAVDWSRHYTWDQGDLLQMIQFPPNFDPCYRHFWEGSIALVGITNNTYKPTKNPSDHHQSVLWVLWGFPPPCYRFGAFFLKQMRSPAVFPTVVYPFCTFKCASLAPSTTPLALKKTSVVLWATAVGIPKSRRRIIL